MDLFEKIKNIFEKNEKPIGQKNNDIFMINRFLSMHPESLLEAEYSNYFNGKIPNEYLEYLLYYTVDKKNKAPFIKYIKKNTESKIDQKVLTKVCTIFNCNERHGKEIIETLKAEGKNLKQTFGIN